MESSFGCYSIGVKPYFSLFNWDDLNLPCLPNETFLIVSSGLNAAGGSPPKEDLTRAISTIQPFDKHEVEIPIYRGRSVAV